MWNFQIVRNNKIQIGMTIKFILQLVKIFLVREGKAGEVDLSVDIIMPLQQEGGGGKKVSPEPSMEYNPPPPTEEQVEKEEVGSKSL